MVLLLTILIVVPIAAVAFARSGKALDQLGKGQFSIDRDDDLGSGMTAADSPAAAEQERADEVRQMIEAADFRSQARGEGRLDVEREIERLLSREASEPNPGATAAGAATRSGGVPGPDQNRHHLPTPESEPRCGNWSSPTTSAGSGEAKTRST